MTVLGGAKVVTPDGVLDPGWVRLEDGLIVEIGHGPVPDPLPVGDEMLHFRSSWLVAGFVDMHVHGGGGHAVTSGDPVEAAAALAFHRHHGTTTSLMSLVTAPIDVLERAIRRLAGLVEGGRRPDGSVGSIAGIHLEGPFLSVDACGAQDPTWMCPPDHDSIERLIGEGNGAVRVVTVAPEIQGGLAAVEQLVGAGVIAAVGHTRAEHEQAAAAFDAGATVATHLFNCMGAFHHRDPGTVGAALADDRVVAELILDGEHVHDDTARIAIGAKSSERVALITDAIPLAGAGDGDIPLGSTSIEVRDGVARVSGSGVLAGSTLTLDAAFRRAVAIGATVPEASEMASAVPAAVLGLDATRGTIEVGKHADLVVLDDALNVKQVFVFGEALR